MDLKVEGSNPSSHPNPALREAFRHHLWATRHLLAVCQNLPQGKLEVSGTGTYGGIVATFNHLIRSDARYAARLIGARPVWADPQSDQEYPVGMGELAPRVDEADRLWQQVLAEPLDADRVLVVDKGENSVRAGVIVAQALHHGSVHREQICSILTGLGIEPPDLQAWAYGWATGRLWRNDPAG